MTTASSICDAIPEPGSDWICAELAGRLWHCDCAQLALSRASRHHWSFNMNKPPLFPERVRSHEMLTGPWMSIPNPVVVEILAQAGPDFLLIDGEHAPIAPQTLPLLLPAAEQQDLPVV